MEEGCVLPLGALRYRYPFVQASAKAALSALAPGCSLVTELQNFGHGWQRYWGRTSIRLPTCSVHTGPPLRLGPFWPPSTSSKGSSPCARYKPPTGVSSSCATAGNRHGAGAPGSPST